MHVPEVVGSGVGARLWGLVQAPERSLVAGENVVKIVWRMTGHGPVRLSESDGRGRGRGVALAWGPKLHGGAGASNYTRPGVEWGAGYRFPHPGCYRLAARRAMSSDLVWLRVARRAT